MLQVTCVTLHMTLVFMVFTLNDNKQKPIRAREFTLLLQYLLLTMVLFYFSVSLTQCTHPVFADTVADDTIVYIRAECRLCQCKMGELICGQKPQFCDRQLAKKPCAMEKGGEMADGERHFDGCNHCLCRNGKRSMKPLGAGGESMHSPPLSQLISIRFESRVTSQVTKGLFITEILQMYLKLIHVMVLCLYLKCYLGKSYAF